MIYESSYTTGQQPFVADLKRGFWSSANDFVYAGLSLGFRLDVFALSWIARIETGVSGFFPTYLLGLAFYVVPLLVVKSFMGQFSRSGFISSFRLSPMFKGIGLITLFLNISVVIYYSLFAMIPLVYLVASFKPTLPWSCDSAKEWANEKDFILCPFDENKQCTGDFYGCFGAEVASSLYFIKLFTPYTVFGKVSRISWQLILSAIGVWLIIIFIILKLSIEKIGLLIRYSVWFLVAVLLLFIVRFSFLPGTVKHYEQIFSLSLESFVNELGKLPAYGLCAFGPGWGLFISLASFNRFKTNITRSSWLIGIGQMFIIFGMDMLEKFINLYLRSSTNDNFTREHTQFRTFFLSSGSALATLSLPNLWCILFYLMLVVASLNLMVLQLHSIFASIYDEYVWLRTRKMQLSLKVMLLMALCSLYFTTRIGYDSSIDIVCDTFIWQSLINLLLILVVTWIYGRERLQRDLNFMSGGQFATWKIYVLRFFAPLCMVAVLFFTIIISLFNTAFSGRPLTLIDLILRTMPWLAIPVYIAYCLYRSQGSLKERFVKCCRPTDWYPVEADDRQRYENAVNTSNMTHPLSELNNDYDGDDDVFVDI